LLGEATGYLAERAQRYIQDMASAFSFRAWAAVSISAPHKLSATVSSPDRLFFYVALM
jgi:hypothetical protein